MTTKHSATARKIREELNHPIIDTDFLVGTAVEKAVAELPLEGKS